MGRRYLAAFVAMTLATGLLLTACGQASGASTVAVTETIFNITVQPNKIQAGKVRFVVTNPSIMRHEFLVIRTDLGPSDLPTDFDGHVNEDAIDILDTIEDVPPRGSGALPIDLPAGHYVLICNLVQEHDGEKHVHYRLGMRTAFTVR